MGENLTAKEFETLFIQHNDYLKLAELIEPLLSNFIFKNRRYDSWNNIFRKCEKIMNAIFKNNFENGFQSKHFTPGESRLLICLFKFFQRIQMFSNNSIDIPCKDLFLSFALCFDIEISIQAFKVMSLYLYKEKFLKNNTLQIEILLKLVNVPGLRIKKYLYDDDYVLAKTNAIFFNDPLQYFNENKFDQNISDLYVEANKLLCDNEDLVYIIRIYSLITMGASIVRPEEILKTLKDKILKRNNNKFIDNELKFLLDEFIFYLLRIDCDENIIKQIIQENNFLEKRLIYDELTPFESISIFSNISEINFDVNYSLTNTVSNPDLDFQYFSGIYSLVKRDTNVFSSCIDLDNFKSLLLHFDEYHSKKDKFVLKIIFKIMNEVYKKGSAYFEPFEESKYCKKCLFLIKEKSEVFSSLCIDTLTFFINNDPLSISIIPQSCIYEIFENFIASEEMYIALLNLFDALSLNKNLSKNFVDTKLLSSLLEKVLLIQDGFFNGFGSQFTILIKHHPQYELELIDFILLSMKLKLPTSSLFNFVSTQELLFYRSIIWNGESGILNVVDTLFKNNFLTKHIWQDSFFNLFTSGCIQIYNISVEDYENIFNFYADKILEGYKNNILDLAEMYLNLICHTILNRKTRFNDEDDESHSNLSNIFYILTSILPSIILKLESFSVVDYFEAGEEYKNDVYKLIWLEINYIFLYVWRMESVQENRNCFNYFLNCINYRNDEISKKIKHEHSYDVLDDNQKHFYKNILDSNLSKLSTSIIYIFFDWLFANNVIDQEILWSKKELCILFKSLEDKQLELKNEYIEKLLNFFNSYDTDISIITFLDNILFCSDYSNPKYIDKIFNLYIKFYIKGNEIKYKTLLYDEKFSIRLIENGCFKAFIGAQDLCINFLKGNFVVNNEFVELCTTTLKDLTFKNEKYIFIENEKILQFLNFKNIKPRIKMAFLLSYIKYIKSQDQEIHNIEPIYKYIIKKISIKNNQTTKLLIKCILLHIFDHSRDLIDYKIDFSPSRFISANYLAAYHNIRFFKKAFEKVILHNNVDIQKNGFLDTTQHLFKIMMKKSTKNINCLNVLTEILTNNFTYDCLINKKFLRTISKRYIETVDLGYKIDLNSSFYVALNFFVHCLQSKNKKLSKMTYKVLLKQMIIYKNHKIYNFLVILYTSLGAPNIIKSGYETGFFENDSDFLLSGYFIKKGIANIFFEILSNVKEKDLRIINFSSCDEESIDQLGLSAWNNIKEANKVSYIYSFLSHLYDKEYDYLLDLQEEDEEEYEEDEEDFDYDEMYIPENLTPECSSYEDNVEIEELVEKPKKRSIYNSLYSAYFLCEKECYILENKRIITFLDKLIRIIKDEYKIENINEELQNADSNVPINNENIIELYDDEMDEIYYSEEEEYNFNDNINLENENFNIDEDFSVSEESILGIDNGVIPDIHVDDINNMNEEELDDFIKNWYIERKSSNHKYLPIDINFLNNLNETVKEKFEENERILKDDYFEYAPDYEVIEESSSHVNEDIDTFLDISIYEKFLVSYLSKDFSLKTELTDILEILCFNSNLRSCTFKIIKEKIEDFTNAKKCIRIVKSMLLSSKHEIEKDFDLVIALIKFSSIQEYHENALQILSKLKISNSFSNFLHNLSDVTSVNLTSRSLEHFKTFCKNNLKQNILDFIYILLNNYERNLSLLVDFTVLYHQQTMNNFKLTRKVYSHDFNVLHKLRKFDESSDIFFPCPKIFEKLDKIFTNQLFDYTHLTLFGLYEEFINWLSFFNIENKREIIDKFIVKRSNLTNIIYEKQDEINSTLQTNDIIIFFLSKFKVLSFKNKKKFLISKMNYYEAGSFIITVRRSSILNDSFFQVMRKSSKELKAKRIQIKFSGEQGIDFGGLTKEWLELVMQEALKPDQGLFVYSSDKRNSLHPFKNSKIDPDHLSFFRFIGRILAKIIIEGFNISIHFDKSVYKYLLGLKCTLQDLEEIDPQFYNSLMWIKNNKIENILNLTFSVENNNFGFNEIIDLIPEGRQVLVTDDNKNDYIDLVVENRLIKSVEKQLNAMREGLFEMIDEDIICIFNEKELELLICGIPDINIDDWKNNTEYIGYTSHSRNISWFWKAVEGFTPEEKAKLLQFCTGSSRVPFEGFKNLQSTNGYQKFSINKISTNRLPSAHTCFNQLDLPEYTSYEELRKNILYAINECQGGFYII